jgi:DNA-binding Xre family transcriptional regulator
MIAARDYAASFALSLMVKDASLAASLAAESGVPAERVAEHQGRSAEDFTFDELDRYCRALDCQPGDILKMEVG